MKNVHIWLVSYYICISRSTIQRNVNQQMYILLLSLLTRTFAVGFYRMLSCSAWIIHARLCMSRTSARPSTTLLPSPYPPRSVCRYVCVRVYVYVCMCVCVFTAVLAACRFRPASAADGAGISSSRSHSRRFRYNNLR